MSSRFRQKDEKGPKIDTKYYDELFMRIKDENSEEFADKESLGNNNFEVQEISKPGNFNSILDQCIPYLFFILKKKRYLIRQCS